MRQSELYSKEEWQRAVKEVAQVQAGPIAGRSQTVGEGDGQWFAVEKVLDLRSRGRKREVLVKWQGYEEPTWIDESQVEEEALRLMLAERKRELALQEGRGRKSRLRRRRTAEDGDE